MTGVASCAHPVGLRIVLTMAMALPMSILYAVGTLGPFLVRDLHIRPGLLGYLTMSAFACAAVLSPWAGPLVERLGARRGLLLLFAAVALAYVLMIAVPGFAGVFAAVAACGVAQALCNPVTNLVIAQRVAPRNKAFAVGMKQAGVQIAALFIGLALPGIALRFGWRIALAGMVPLALAAAAATPFIAAGMAGKAGALMLPRPNVLLRLLMGIQFCAGAALSAYITFLPMFAAQHGLSPSRAGLLVATFGAMGIFSRLGLTPLAARLRDESGLLLALLALAAGAIGVTLQAEAASQWKLWLGAAGIGLTAVAANAVAMGMLLRDAAFGAPAAASGLLSAAFFAGCAAGPPAFGAVVNSRYGFAGAWSALAAVLSAGCLTALALILARRRKAR